VETSQCIVDALYGALGILAPPGNHEQPDLRGCAPAVLRNHRRRRRRGADFDGCDAVQTHMTNSRLTDPEILESHSRCCAGVRDPRRLGRRGRHHGGGRHRAAAGVSCAVLRSIARNHPHRALWLEGGQPAPAVRRAYAAPAGPWSTWAPTACFEIGPGDELLILTPGGGRLWLTAYLSALDRRQKPRLLPACLSAAGGWPAKAPQAPSPIHADCVSISHSTRCFAVAERFTDTGRTPAGAGSMRHQPGVERARLAAGEAEQQVELPSARVCGR